MVMMQLEKKVEVLERLTKEKKGTPVAVSYTEEGKPDRMYQACGFLREEIHSAQAKMVLDNGINVLPYSLPARNHVFIEIPAKNIVDYFVIQKDKN